MGIGANAQPSSGAVASASHEPQATQSDRPSAALQQESAQDESYQRGNPAAEDQGQQTRHEESTVPAQNDDWGDFVS